MARKVHGGVVGGSGLGGLSATGTTLTAIEDEDITIDPAGTGILKIAGDTQLESQSDLRFADADSSNFVAFQAPATIATNYTLTLPAAVAASNGFALVSDTGGTLSWAAAGAALSDNNTDSATNYITFTTATSGNLTAARVASTTRALTYQPSTGTLSTTLFNETSSIELKENFRPINDALGKILQLTGLIYDRRDGSTKNEAGLIAEDVDRIIPEVVTRNTDGEPKSIAYQRLVTYLIESVKSLKQEINEIKGVK